MLDGNLVILRDIDRVLNCDFTGCVEGTVGHLWPVLKARCYPDGAVAGVDELSALRSEGTFLLELSGGLGDCPGSLAVYCDVDAGIRSWEPAPCVA